MTSQRSAFCPVLEQRVRTVPAEKQGESCSREPGAGVSGVRALPSPPLCPLGPTSGMTGWLSDRPQASSREEEKGNECIVWD